MFESNSKFRKAPLNLDEIERSETKNYSEKQTLNDNVSEHYCLYFYLVFLIAMMTNVGFIMVSTIAHDLAAMFNKRRFMPLFQFFEDLLSAYIWYANSRYFIKIPHLHRLVFNSVIIIASYILMAILIIHVFDFGFYLTLL